MRFVLTEEQAALRDALDGVISSSDPSSVWSRLDDLGINDLVAEATPVEVVITFEALGRHAVEDAVASVAGVADDGELATLATAAYLLGAGERVLTDTVAYAKQRRQFGREIGSYQAIKHKLADVRIALDFARPLVFGAALAIGPRSVSAAKVQAGEAAYLASRTGLQVHGAIGYTRELELSRWITLIRELQSAYGTAAYHRRRILDSLLAERA
ncbi:MAG TPA: acyl-CoA dehydrogenase family protein [Nocardioides sp.]|nr:acyl-CoA dehydrogenase family protein [Nocardioides sp.]